MDESCLSSTEELPSLYGKGAPRPCVVTPHQGSAPHAVFYDVTHDNETPNDKRTAEDALSTGALVTFTRAALGSNKGFDDLYPKLLNLVTDNRMYEVNETGEGGIGKVKRVLNHLHTEMMSNGFTEGHVHEEGEVSPDRALARTVPAEQILTSSTSWFIEFTRLLTRDTCSLRIPPSLDSKVEDGVSPSPDYFHSIRKKKNC
jgi:hypothetical protein